MPTPNPTTRLDTLSVKDLHARYLAVFGTPTVSRNRPWLIRKLEASAAGAPKRAAPKAERRAVPLPTQAEETPNKAVAALGLPIGATIEKTFKGRELVLTVRADGFEIAGIVYRSLSAAATAIAGSNWNGHVFFGLKKRGGKE